VDGRAEEDDDAVEAQSPPEEPDPDEEELPNEPNSGEGEVVERFATPLAISQHLGGRDACETASGVGHPPAVVT
jgi:hypothetical protein